MSTSSAQPQPLPISPLQTTVPSATGTWQYNGYELDWETSDPSSVTITLPGCAPQTLTKSSPQCHLQGAPLPMEARLEFSSLTQMGSLVLSIQLSSGILFKTSVGGWSINTSPPNTLSPWWPTPEQQSPPADQAAPPRPTGNSQGNGSGDINLP